MNHILWKTNPTPIILSKLQGKGHKDSLLTITALLERGASRADKFVAACFKMRILRSTSLLSYQEEGGN